MVSELHCHTHASMHAHTYTQAHTIILTKHYRHHVHDYTYACEFVPLFTTGTNSNHQNIRVKESSIKPSLKTSC